MGHRALIGKTLPSGEVEIYYSQWGALNAYDAEGKIEVPEHESENENEKWTVHHEAVWLDGVCYCPVWVFPSEGVPVEKWKTKGQGILLKAENGVAFNKHKMLSEFRHIWRI